MSFPQGELRDAERVNLAGTDRAGRECLSHTRIGTYLACSQRYQWQYVRRLEQAVRPEALSRGAAFAHALETGSPQSGFSVVMEEHAALIEEHGNSVWVSLPSESDALRVATIVRAAACAYLARYGQQDVRREVTLRQVLRNPSTGCASRTFDVMARIDGQTGSTLIEDKFSARVDAITDQRLRLDRQTMLGAYLLWRCEGVDVTEVKYRVTKTPSIKQKQAESLEEYLSRVECDYRDRPDFYLHEFTLTFSRTDFLRLEHELWDWAHQIRHANAAGVYPRNVASCADYSGCKFLGLCAREPGAIHQFTERERSLR